jgi:hypothetical protein
MQVKIRFNLPINGYKADIQQAREDNAFDEWIDRRFGDRIRDVISNDFTMIIEENSFIVDFTYGDDSDQFLRTFGGRIVE